MNYNLITILGPTAVGKTKLAAHLAHLFDGEVISADSRQVYRKLNLGTGKDYDDYQVKDSTIKYHLVDVIDLPDEFNLFDFYKCFFETYNKVKSNDKLPFLCGGTGLYISSVVQNYNLKEVENENDIAADFQNKTEDELKSILIHLNPKLHNTTDFTSKERLIKAIQVALATNEVSGKININSLNIGINPGREEVKNRIKQRLISRLKEGMVEEVKQILESGISAERLIKLGLEYKFITEYLTGIISYDEMQTNLYYAISRYSKRQMTWFRKMEREGVKIFWLTKPDIESAKEIIEANYAF